MWTLHLGQIFAWRLRAFYRLHDVHYDDEFADLLEAVELPSYYEICAEEATWD